MVAKRRIIIDTDPGQDDAVAIMLALASSYEIEVAAIVTVAGNVSLEQTSRNACMVLELAARTDVPVYAGCAAPMQRAHVAATHVHGPSGLDGPTLPPPTMTLQTKHGVDFLVDTLIAAEAGTYTLCTLGPLTNIANAFVRAPKIASQLREIVMMGGAYFEVGNITPAAEFNIYVDPEAADIVMRSGVPITMLPLDVTHRALATRGRLERIGSLGNRCGKVIFDMLNFSQRFDLDKYGWEGAPMHDPCVIAYLLNPDLFSGRTINVSIETLSALTRGMTVADYWKITDRTRNVAYMRDVDAEGFYTLLTERLAMLP
jgi:purine nucleosidase